LEEEYRCLKKRTIDVSVATGLALWSSKWERMDLLREKTAACVIRERTAAEGER
jgi:hypothetical protein